MNNPEDMPVDIDEMRAWLFKHKGGGSWTPLVADSGIPLANLSAFANGTYQGRNDNMARRVYQYRQKVESQDNRAREVLAPARFIETPTAQNLIFLLERAQMGRMTLAATGPGTSKTKAAEHYKDSIGATVFLATMEQSTKTVSAMIAEVQKAMGFRTRSGWVQQRSSEIIDFVSGRRALLIVDEANNLGLESLEQLRSWHDKAGLGIALFGNEELELRLNGQVANNRHAYRRLNSRIANRLVQDVPLEADVLAYCDAFDLIEKPIRKLLTDVALSPGHGGLREVQQILESANMLAVKRDEPLGLVHIEQSMALRVTKILRRAA